MQQAKKMGDAIIDLSKLLDQGDFSRVAGFSERLNRFLHGALVAKSYKDFAVSTSKLIQQAQNIVGMLGEKYGFNPSNFS